MDHNYLRTHFYDLWIGHHISFETVNGRYFSGKLGNWLEDGTLLLINLAEYDKDENCVKNWPDESLFNFEQIQFISSLDALPSELITEAMEKHWDDMAKIGTRKAKRES